MVDNCNADRICEKENIDANLFIWLQVQYASVSECVCVCFIKRVLFIL